MKNLTLLGALALLVAACGDKDDSGAAGDRASDILALTGDAAAGETVYTGNCSGCHGADGAGSDSFPSLVGVTASEGTINTVLDGISGTAMGSYASLSDQDIADLFAHIETF